MGRRFRAPWVALCAVAAALTFHTAPAHTATKQLALSAGAAFPTNPESFTRVYNPGFSGAAAFRLGFSAAFALTFLADYSIFGWEELTNQDPNLVLHRDAASVFYAAAGVRVVPLASTGWALQPVLLAGLGYYRENTGDHTVTRNGQVESYQGHSNSVPGAHVGAGLDYRAFFVEVSWVMGIGFYSGGEWEAFLPVRVGYVFGFGGAAE